MVMYLLYWGLLVAWVILLWPAFRLKGAGRVWLQVVIAAGIAALVYETYMYLWSLADIRLDILLIAMALGCLYGSAAALLVWNSWHKAAAALGIALMVIGGGMIAKWVETGREAQRLDGIFEETNRLLFQAKFRHLGTYASYFRMFDARPTLFPVGHWFETQEGGYFSRLLINPEGRVWAFYRCGKTECQYNSLGPGIQPVGDPAKKRWAVTMKASIGAPVTLRIAQPSLGQLTIEGRGQPTTLTKTQPPIDPAPAPESLIFLGSFVQMECRGRHADVRQLWLWQEDTRLYALGIFSTLVAGARAGFVAPVLLGEGVRRDDTWSFEWQRSGQPWKATVAIQGPAALLTLEQHREPAVTATLARGAIFRDEAIELAPLTSKADWVHWFDMVLTGHHSSGDIPPC